MFLMPKINNMTKGPLVLKKMGPLVLKKMLAKFMGYTKAYLKECYHRNQSESDLK